MKRPVLDKASTGVLIIDFQEKLFSLMKHRQKVADNTIKLIRLATVYDLPILLTEQNSKHLGGTVEEIRSVLPDYSPIEKIDFNCGAVDEFNTRLDSLNLKNLIVIGIETHICVYQTCMDLLERNYGIHVPGDAVDSRKESDMRTGLNLMDKYGATITSTETIIFQLLERAGTNEFREMLKVVK